MSRDDELRGIDEPLAVLEDTHEPSWAENGRMYPDILGWRLTHALGEPDTTAGDGVVEDPDGDPIPVGAHLHVWEAPFGPAGVSPLTVEKLVAYKDQNVYFRMRGCALQELGVNTPEQGGAVLQASGPALFMSDPIANPALTPALESLGVRPFVRGNLTLPDWLTGSGVHEDFGLTINNPVEVARSLGIASKYPDAMEKSSDGGPIVVSGSLSQRQLDADDIVALKRAAGFEALARWVSDSIIAGGFPYKLFVGMANCQYTEGDPVALRNQRRHGAQFSFKSTTAGLGSTTISLINATAAYTVA